MTQTVKITIKHLVGFNKDCTPRYELQEDDFTVHACSEEEMCDKIRNLRMSYGDNQVFPKKRLSDGKIGVPTLFTLD